MLIIRAVSGIGEQMSYMYTKKGANMMMVSRREDGLKTIVNKSCSLATKMFM